VRHGYKVVLLAGFLVLPLLTLVWGNAFRSRRRTLLRAAAAVAVGWGWLLASALAVTEVDLRLAGSAAEAERIAAGDGAKHVAAAVFGWVPALLLVTLYWGAVRTTLWARGRGARGA
jgi:hypothetical protein